MMLYNVLTGNNCCCWCLAAESDIDATVRPITISSIRIAEASWSGLDLFLCSGHVGLSWCAAAAAAAATPAAGAS